ncbi:MAG: hypothetical protein J6L76_01710 [Clostridia bacterium]|nr:hypothetical protein [Clostridia bacterium]
MLSAIIENGGNSLVMKLPCKWRTMGEQLASIGVMSPQQVRCTDEENEAIKVKLYGNSEFENKLASFVSPDNTMVEQVDALNARLYQFIDSTKNNG